MGANTKMTIIPMDTALDVIEDIKGVGGKKIQKLREKGNEVGWEKFYFDLRDGNANIPHITSEVKQRIAERLRKFEESYNPDIDIESGAAKVWREMSKVDKVKKFKDEVMEKVMVDESSLVNIDSENLDDCKKQFEKVEGEMINRVTEFASEQFQELVAEKIENESEAEETS